MSRKFLIFLVYLFCVFHQNAEPAGVTDSSNCKKCDKAIIEIATEKYDKLAGIELEQFLCSFDKKCKLNEKYKNSGGTYNQIAFESLVVQLDRNLDLCVKLFDSNKNIDFSYILILLEKVAGHDLPWPSIMSKLKKKASLSVTEQRIFKAIKKSETELKKKYGQ